MHMAVWLFVSVCVCARGVCWGAALRTFEPNVRFKELEVFGVALPNFKFGVLGIGCLNCTVAKADIRQAVVIGRAQWIDFSDVWFKCWESNAAFCNTVDSA